MAPETPSSIHLTIIRTAFALTVGLALVLIYIEPMKLYIMAYGTTPVVGKDLGYRGLKADDPRVIQHIHQHVIVPPSTKPYKLHYGVNADPSDGQSKIIDRILKRKRNGFYIESGGYTGEVLSNTLFFEIQRNWSGILIEPSEELYKKIVSRNRKAFLAKACIGEANIAKEALFSNAKYAGRIVHAQSIALGSEAGLSQVECFPLYSFLLALGNPSVDYFSLDVENSEYKVLQSIPWDKVDIKTLSVEFNLIPEGAPALLEFMKSKDYVHYMTYVRPYTHDYIFVKPELLDVQNQLHKNLPVINSNNSIEWAVRWDLNSR